MKAILGRKLEMTQIFQDEKVIPVTLVEAGPCKVTKIRTPEKDGYEAVQMKYGNNVVEFRNVQGEEGSTVDVSVFEEGNTVQVSGISKGKGFQGGVKRHGFHGRNATHGVKHEERTIGSIGSAYPERVIKGRKMPGRMGADRVTVKNLKIAKVDTEHNIVAVRGAIPGRRGTLLELRG
jgi:large subunit ribosomal protein L3